jgi:hypothetical protein
MVLGGILDVTLGLWGKEIGEDLQTKMISRVIGDKRNWLWLLPEAMEPGKDCNMLRTGHPANRSAGPLYGTTGPSSRGKWTGGTRGVRAAERTCFDLHKAAVRLSTTRPNGRLCAIALRSVCMCQVAEGKGSMPPSPRIRCEITSLEWCPRAKG